MYFHHMFTAVWATRGLSLAFMLSGNEYLICAMVMGQLGPFKEPVRRLIANHLPFIGASKGTGVAAAHYTFPRSTEGYGRWPTGTGAQKITAIISLLLRTKFSGTACNPA